MAKWEYKFLEINTTSIEEKLNSLGQETWEAMSFKESPMRGVWQVLLKRQCRVSQQQFMAGIDG